MQDQMKQVLELFSQPAFLVLDGTVCWCNGAARSILTEGTALTAILEGNDVLFSQWDRTGTLMIPVILSGEALDASVRATDDGDLFVANHRAPETDYTASAFVSASASLRKPLQAMVSAADALFEQLGESAQAEEAAARMNQSIYQFVRLCNQMSDGGRLLLHRKQAVRQPTDLNLFFDHFISQIKPLAASTGRILEFIPFTTPIHADVDTELLERALYNLIANALSYTPKGGTVKLSGRRENDLFLINVSDTGSGISQEVLSSLFERFSSHGIGDSRRGIGLGLAMVREIARLHGGTLSVNASEEGHGTAVTFSISLAKAPLSLHTPVVIDYCPGFHHGLVELSEVLDAKMFNPNEVS